MWEGGTPVPSSRGLPAPEAGASLALVRQLPLDDADLLPQGLGSARLADAVLPQADLVQTRLQVVQLLLQREAPPVLWQEQVCWGRGGRENNPRGAQT